MEPTRCHRLSCEIGMHLGQCPLEEVANGRDSYSTPSKIRSRMLFLQDYLLARRRILSEPSGQQEAGIGGGRGARAWWGLLSTCFLTSLHPLALLPLPLALLAPDPDLVSRYPGKPKAPTLGRTVVEGPQIAAWTSCWPHRRKNQAEVRTC